MLKHTKGFTLIELLAVIAILAIVLLIAVPKIISTVENTKKASFKTNAQLLVKAIDLKKASDESFNLLTLNASNVKENLNADNTNYESLTITTVDNKINITLMGSNVWGKYVVAGTVDNLVVMNKDEFISASILKFVGSNPDTVTCNLTGNYVDEGVDIVDPDNVTAANIYSNETIALSNVGEHFLPYQYKNLLNITYGIARNVIIENNNTPTITIEPNITEIQHIAGDVFIPPTATASDPCEGSLEVTIESDVVPTIEGTYTLTYKATNKGNITSTKKITVSVSDTDKIPPVITMLGSSPLTLGKGSSYNDAGATATDNIDSSVTVNVTSTLVTTVVGTYTITYSATDAAGNIATPVVRTINVVDSVTAFAYTGTTQSFNVALTGKYKIELWGAQGGRNATNNGMGGYTSGEINLTSGNVLYIHVGGFNNNESYNCGAINWNVYNGYTTGGGCACGGGATDVRLVSGAWNNETGINSRIMVAGAGGGALYSLYGGYGGAGGGITGSPSNSNVAGGTQTSGGAFGISSPATTISGNGYYSGTEGSAKNAGGGSSFISGHTGCVAISSATDRTPKVGCTTSTTTLSCSYHYSNYIFTNTKMINGNGYLWSNVIGNQTPMPSKTIGQYYANGIGSTGTGYARITFISSD